VKALEVADGAQGSPPTADRAVARTSVPEPLVSFQSRHRALELVASGNLLGAWAIAQPLHNDETERAWTEVIDWVRCFASSLPIPQKCDIPVLMHRRMAARAALRVELALRAGDIPRAVHGTVAFFEAALWDHVLDRFELTHTKRCGLPVLRRKPDSPAPSGNKLLRNDEPDEREKRNCPFKRLNHDTYLFFEDGAGRFARHYVRSKRLKCLTDAIAKIRDLRNDVAHNEPTPDLMRDAQDRMQEAGLWSKSKPPGFLSQPLVQGPLSELGVEDPGSLRETLIKHVRERLLAFSNASPRVPLGPSSHVAASTGKARP
jgi:hypothetical protein